MVKIVSEDIGVNLGYKFWFNLLNLCILYYFYDVEE